MLPTELLRLDWYKRASGNLRKYLAELEDGGDVLRSRGIAVGATENLIVEVKRRLRDLDRLIAEAEADPIVETGRIAKII